MSKLTQRTSGVVIALLPAAAIAVAVASSLASPQQASRQPELVRAPADTHEIITSSALAGMKATLVVRDLETGRTRVHNPTRADTPFTPASTFKIPSSMIALETGVADGPEFALVWDEHRDPPTGFFPESWRHNHTLRTAFSNSVVWYYRELARRIGEERMRTWIDKLDYGNRNIAGGIDRFWLDGELRISAHQQVAFLERFARGRLPLSERTTRVMREIMLIEETPEFRLSGKTGTSIRAAQQIGWWVGFVEVQGRTSVIALNLDDEDVLKNWPPARRVQLVKSALAELGVISISI